MDRLTDFVIWLPAILVGLTFHEYAHARVADALGDNTPYYQGRLTLNPLSHIDWLGFLLLALVHFGWAKPVQVNPYNFKRVSMKTGMMLVSLAGPLMNILVAIVGLLAIKYLPTFTGGSTLYIADQLLQPLVWINVILASFNLIPIPPLDGYKILAGLLPGRQAGFMYSLEPYGTLILMLLIVTGVMGTVLDPFIRLVMGILKLVVA
ncbi:MAG TPA: site-2 protease family protein [Syntrophothermus lipocalidus]|uniref:Peptidase M50 n=1 Tax=Syntrophothermus lipocalidus (strain DSM 12680 / TGB-C1) TaxID=643648 RepID=D7CKT6_SYNLT|nr:site-2 protease family protein [Syntrophothermus lipocalidus]ADI01321.1 peptidase M50 [Syntrophothermus lipocalidus DSM 12680]HHV76319.1 site-2 protease family protein [Syntrophothermus lipocalidus]HOV43185.1 site-2 protease family protein [Syntrophothermus lipocalidus]